MKSALLAEVYKQFKIRELYWLLGLFILILLIFSLAKSSVSRDEFGYFLSATESNKWLSVVNLRYSILGLLSPLFFGVFTSWMVYYEYKDGTSRHYSILPGSSFGKFSAKFLSLGLSLLSISILVAVLFPGLLILFNINNEYLWQSPLPWLELFGLSIVLMLKVLVSSLGFVAILFMISFFMKRVILSIGITTVIWLTGIVLRPAFFPSTLSVRSIVTWQRKLSEGDFLSGFSFLSEVVSLVYIALIFVLAFFYFRDNHLYKS